jgi:hypothetical protein
MLAKRLPLLSFFAGGCLSGALFIGFWREDPAPSSLPKHAAALEPIARGLALAEPGGSVAYGANTGPASAATEPQHEPAPATRAGGSAAGAEHAPEAAAHAGDAESAAAPGSSVADVLSRLEAAYRQARAADATEARAVAATEIASSAPPSAAAAEQLQASAPPPSASPAAPVQAVAAPHGAVIATAEPTAPPTEKVSVAGTEPALAEAEAKPSRAAEAGAPRVVYTGSVQQNVYVGNVHQGDLYYQSQQVAMLQYLQLLALASSGPVVAPPPTRPSRHATQTPRQLRTRRAPAFPSSITNPDNPWGFDFPPPVLAK